MDIVNRAMQGTNDLEEMMKNVLDALLSIFACDRAWCVYPCDPDAETWQVPMERTRPEYPGVLPLGVELPMDPAGRTVHRILREADGPVTFGPGSAHAIPDEIAGPSQVKSFIAVAVFPKLRKPWSFGLHQCSYARQWTAEEVQLMQAVGRRLSDALTSVLVFQDLRRSEEENRAIVQAVPDLLFRVGREGVVLDSRDRGPGGTTGQGARSPGWTIDEIVPPDVVPLAAGAIERARRTRQVATFEYQTATPRPPRFYEGRVVALPGEEVLVVVRDVTDRKKSEIEITRANRTLRMLSSTNEALIHNTDEGQLLNEVCRIAVEVGGYRMAWVGFLGEDDSKSVSPAAYAGHEAGYVAAANVSWGDTERGRGPMGTAIRTGRPSVIREIRTDGSFVPWRRAATDRGYESCIALPLISDEGTLGALGIYAAEANAFDIAEVDILRELAGNLAFGIAALRARARRDLAEKALRESEARYRVMAENTADQITVYDLSLNPVYVSPAVEKLLGYTVDERLTLPLGRVLTPSSYKKAMRVLDEQLALEKSGTADPGRTVMFELEEVRKDGSRVWMELSASFLRGKDLRPQGILTITRDISQRKQAESRLIESEEKFRSLAESSPDNIIRYDTDCRLIYVNPNVDQTMGFHLAEHLGERSPRHPDFPAHDSYYARLGEVLRTGAPAEFEVTVRNPAGEQRIHEVRFVAERDKENRIIGALAIGRDITEQKRAEEQVLASLHEKDMLLKEIHHRVKNNLQVVCSLLSMQSQSVSDPEARSVFSQTETRVRSMALVHEKLYRSGDLAEIDFGDYVSGLTRQITAGFNREEIRCDVSTERVMLGIDVAIPCGLIANELITNSFKHAFPDRAQGHIEVTVRRHDDRHVALTVRDDGVGLPEDVDVRSMNTMGMTLINSLADQISASVTVERSAGTAMVITFPA
jgi:PAS domain S-box-containing protein